MMHELHLVKLLILLGTLDEDDVYDMLLDDDDEFMIHSLLY